MTKVDWADNYRTNQIYSSGVELALCSDDNRQIGTMVYCKDFFQDAIVAHLNRESGKICQIFGYKYDPATYPPIPADNLKVLITDSTNDNLGKKIPYLVEMLNQIEDKMGLQRTIAEECVNSPEKYAKCGIYLLTADAKWMHAPPLLSCWTLLARNGLNHKPGDTWQQTIDKIISGETSPGNKNDKTFLEFAKPGVELIVEKGISALFGESQKENYPLDKMGSTMHHYAGIVAYGSCKAKKYFGKWAYPEKETDPPGICFA